MGQFSVEISFSAGSVLGGNQQNDLAERRTCAGWTSPWSFGADKSAGAAKVVSAANELSASCLLRAAPRILARSRRDVLHIKKDISYIIS
jgi:hypothetical protein